MTSPYLMTLSRLSVFIACGLICSTSFAFSLERFTPQGQQQQVREVKARFSEDMVILGSPKSQTVRSGNGSALSVKCNTKEVIGELQWITTREAKLTFDEPLPANSNCTVNVSSQLTSNAGKAAKALPIWQFNTGDPVVTNTWPYAGSNITETQVFVIASNVAPGTNPEQTLARLTPICVTDKVGEKIAFNALPANERKAIIDALKDSLPNATNVRDALIIGRCARPLGDSAKVRLILGARATKQQIAFVTLPALRASVSCEREKSESPCVPVQTIKILFSVPVPAAQASLVTLVSANGKTKQSTLALRNEQAKKQGALINEGEISELEFAAPFEQSSQYTVQFPSGNQAITDADARPLLNGGANALKFQTSEAPPLAKFAANFGVIERQVGALPVTIRHLKEAQGDALKLRHESSLDEKTVIQWMRMADFDQRNERTTRRIAVLAASNAKATNVFVDSLKVEPSKAAQVIGIPLTKPGLHRVELESDVLGKAILATDSGPASPKMYVRAYALVTGMAVHIKTSPENSLVWVTSLETGKVIPSASVKVADCNGQFLWKGTTDASGIARINQALPKANCNKNSASTRAYFGLGPGKIKSVSSNDEEYIAEDQDWLIAFARHKDDFAFALTTWNQGIESWRFNINTGTANQSEGAWFGHTIFARTLLRQGETVYMKHLFRKTGLTGLVRPPAGWNQRWTKLRVTHYGSDQTWDVPLSWSDNATGTSQWVIPASAKLGEYSVVAVASSANDSSDDDKNAKELSLGTFQVQQFKLPALKGAIDIASEGPAVKGALKLNVQMSFMNGGPAAGQSTTVSVLTSSHTPNFSGYGDYNFSSVAATLGIDRGNTANELPKVLARFAQATGSQLIADKLALQLDAKGAGQISVIPPSAGSTETNPSEVAPLSPKQVRVEVNYSDPNGEIQTISNTKIIYPAQWVMGFKSGYWLDESTTAQKLVVLSTKGEAIAGAVIKVEGFQRINHSARKRSVGGFYTYENRTEFKALGEVCTGTSNTLGQIECKIGANAALKGFAGDLLLLASTRDKDNNELHAATSMYRSGNSNDDPNWFEQENSDRIDLVAEKRVVPAGETARIQVRLPFEKATALVAIEREGIIQTQVVEINRSDPVVKVFMTADYAPNVMVSILAIRPRVEPLTWGSFFTWGWRAPIQWWQAKQKSQLPPTALVDLAKPAFRFGVVELQVPATATLKVVVSTPSAKVQPRELVKASIQVSSLDAKQQAAIKDGRVAVAVVDESLLELAPNTSWDLIAALWQPGGWGVETATAQMQVIGKRHFGLKAQAPGGGGGKRGPTRELFETLAYWNPNVQLDDQGKAMIEFPANDSLTRFRIMVFAESGDSLLGSGFTTIDVVKDLQLIAGLSSIVRQGDQVNASTTIRNTTDRIIQAQFTATMNGQIVIDQPLTLAAQSTQIIALPVRVNELADRDNEWELKVQETASKEKSPNILASDRMVVKQPVLPAIATRVIAGQLVRVDGTSELPFQLPANALPGRSAIKVEWASTVVGSLAGVKRYFVEYPFACLEQRTAKSIGLQDSGLWDITMTELPNYLDKDGLAAYWPLSSSSAGGDVALTAHLLRIAHAAGRVIPPEQKDLMLKGLVAVIEGKVKRDSFAPSGYLQYVDVIRRLSALEAVSRYARADAAMLSSIKPEVYAWPTSAVIDWVSTLTRIKFVPAAIKDRDQKLDEAWAVLRNRLQIDSRAMKFTTEDRDAWWWMLADGDTNAARLLDTILDERVQTRAGIAQWLQDLPRLAGGLAGRQRNGHWSTTASNLWGSLAITRYAKAFERDPVTGASNFSLKLAQGKVVEGATSTWQAAPAAPIGAWPWASAAGKEATVSLNHTGTGKPYAAVLLEAAIALKAPVAAGFRVGKTITSVSQAKAGQVSVGDVYRIDLTIDAMQAMTQVAVFDPIPAGASILGSLRESVVEQTKSDTAKPAEANGGRWNFSWPAFDEKRSDSYRVFYDYLRAGKTVVSYTIRISQSGTMKLPATRVEAMYAPEQYGEIPNADWVVVAK